MIRLNVRFDYEQIPMHFVLEVPKGQRVAIVGESGAGKSTLLNLIAGFEQPTSGQIWLNNFNHTATQVAERPVSMLFQDNNVFPHLTVEQNIGLALIPSLKLNSDQKAQVQQIAEQMGIADLLNRRADQLSGGQKQRVALARTLLRKQPILLLDEPFSALDPKRRNELQALVAEICRQQNLTLLMVTHQFEESKSLFDRILMIENGKILTDKLIV
ncbi:thiamine ABC transporter ATP-binding protein [Actinobacillus pleuropneumoniae]|uniref:Thiamine ABC transporter ATP-binding protein n=2 Tax=Actinobacillus pleuropneumoniae TaxID=715 RepID=A0A9Q4DIP5_ACTPL|nr:thiamine ABC transporter ATP-binding protein [Actinobacillus pleuropneumoniae]ASU15153.1 Thiamine import ATP-binding protein ThiQ [Actinobacillus pleuropneumoniae]AWG95748.1 thiamine ABC transporter ATP-binding protein [Actinobacillus pleuropneumoniae serovar 1 str. 4074]AXA21818.1 thiamine ABC transporter ATP-binding protein [Actinobacillus pleuropneumoniae]EFM89504.1 Thiamine import ATP-binding protein thiQ [Actinobacillus pleuropneumoniae serovar 4 str. M62]EFM93752.1 Thiamine import ATP